MNLKTMGANSTFYAHALSLEGDALDFEHRYADAKPILVRALDAFEKGAGPDVDDPVEALRSLAVAEIGLEHPQVPSPSSSGRSLSKESTMPSPGSWRHCASPWRRPWSRAMATLDERESWPSRLAPTRRPAVEETASRGSGDRMRANDVHP